MKVLALRADSGGCAKYRLQEPARVVAEKYDVDIRVQPYANIEGTKDTKTGLTTVTKVDENADLIIVQRPLDHAVLSLIKQAQAQGIAVIVEIDDDFDNIHPSNSAYSLVQPEFSPLSNYRWLRLSAKQADLVTVSTPSLLKYANSGRGRVIRNCVPEAIFNTVMQKPQSPTVGWSGTIQTHPTDLQVVGEKTASTIRSLDARVHVVGDGVGVQSALGLHQGVKFSASGWVPLDEYYAELASSMSVGLVPLDLTPFNEAKSYLKGIEYAALGIPFIASPTEEYKLLESFGVGLTASTPDEWASYLKRWLRNPKSAYMAGNRYQKIIKDSMTYETNADKWYDAWISAIDIRRNR